MTAVRKPPNLRNLQRPDLGHALLTLNAEIREYGLNIQMKSNFEEFRETVEAIPDRGAVTPVFDPAYTRINESNGFWISGTDENGEVVHVQAIRFDRLRSTGLAEHWRKNAVLYGPPGLELDVEGTDFSTGIVAEQITGNVCYHGDFWIHRRWRRLGLAPRLSTFAMLTALSLYSPDYIYAFIVPKNVRRGLSAQYGYLHFHPWAPKWRIVGREEAYDDYLVWISGDELYELWTPGERNADILGEVGQQDNDRLSAM